MYVALTHLQQRETAKGVIMQASVYVIAAQHLLRYAAAI